MVRNAYIVIGANYGDEGKGTVVAHCTKDNTNVLNILTNGGSQRGHSILTSHGSVTFQHFGSGTYHGADSYYSKYFILNPMQFGIEYDKLIVKPKNIYRDKNCRWSTPYDSMANLITEQQQNRHASCCMGIWNTIKRYNETRTMTLDEFVTCNDPLLYLNSVREYYERMITIPADFEDIWHSRTLKIHFYNDCLFMAKAVKPAILADLEYSSLIFENGQGLLLKDTGKDTYDTTPSDTGISYSLELLKDIPDVENVTAHYVTRPYLTRHGDGFIQSASTRKDLSSDVQEDRTNHYNDFQGEFRYGFLGIRQLANRIKNDAKDVKFVVDVTHCDEMDRVSEFKKVFDDVRTYDSPLI